MTQNLDHIKVSVDPKSGKKRFKVRVYYQRAFIKSGIFDSPALARTFYKKTYEAAVREEAKPAKVRRQQRQADAKLDQPLRDWAEIFVQKNPRHLKKNRLSEYLLVGRLLGKRTLRDFGGKAGGELISELDAKWRFMRFERGVRGEPKYNPNKKISAQSLRLRLSALNVLLKFASDKLPEGVEWNTPIMPFGYDKPAAYDNPRTRLPSDHEFMTLLRRFGEQSDMGEFLQVIDETGCRLSEILNACGDDIKLFKHNDTVTGGALKLIHHKTAATTGEREVPLAQHAAEILWQRKEKYGDGKLFPQLTSTDSVCKCFDAACKELGIDSLQIKDFRRAFVTRSILVLSDLERAKIVGSSSLTSQKKLDNASETVKTAVGHSRPKTTLGYVVTNEEKTATRLTWASRLPKIHTMLSATASTPIGTPSTASSRTANGLTESISMNSVGTHGESKMPAITNSNGSKSNCPSSKTDDATLRRNGSEIDSTGNANACATTTPIQGVTR